MSKRDDFVASEMARLRQPGETILNQATVYNGPLFLASMLGVAGQLLMLTHYYAVLTDRRLLLIRTSMGLMGLKAANHGVTEIPISELTQVKTGGFLNQRTFTLYHRSGQTTKLRCNSMVRMLSGQKEFAREAADRLQDLIASGKKEAEPVAYRHY